MRFFVFKVLMPCPECGSSVALEGPSLSVTCTACHSTLQLAPENWMGALEFRKYEAEFSLTEGKTRGSSLTNGELRLLVRWGPARPVCPGCAAPMPADAVPPGGDGRLSCKCGQSIATFPTPEWLRRVVPTAVQLFGATREGVPEDLYLPDALWHALHPVKKRAPFWVAFDE